MSRFEWFYVAIETVSMNKIESFMVIFFLYLICEKH